MKIHSTTSGFTLLEAIVIISIISLLAVFGLPAFWRYLSFHYLAGEANQFAGNLRKAQQLTVTEQKIYKVKIAGDFNSYQLIKEEEVISTTQINPRISLSTSLLEISFNFAGAPSQSGEFIFTNELNQQRIVFLNPAGFIKVE